jgi:hypothetical protein
METWTFTALFPDDPLTHNQDFECRHTGPTHPGYLLTQAVYRKILTYKGGKIKKSVKAYHGLAAQP